jgi:drug/metabolite transporter (DMT)-like permease
VLAFVSAALFGAMPVAVRYALPHPLPVIAGTVIMQVGAFAVLAVAALVQGGVTVDGALPFLLVGAIAPGLSQIFIMLGIRDAGSARASLVFGCAPLFAVALAVGFFGERPGPEILLGASLVVGGGLVLAAEGDRPAHVRTIGLVFAAVGAALFALRDNIVRHLSLDTDVPSMTAGAIMLAAGLVVTASFALARRESVRASPRVVAHWLVPGGLVGFSYVALFEAFYRGTVSVVTPIVATESLFGVAFSAWLLGRSEGVGRRLVAGTLLVVSGAVLITVFS